MATERLADMIKIYIVEALCYIYIANPYQSILLHAQHAVTEQDPDTKFPSIFPGDMQ
jgi:hypothetical protein